ncbi:MAG: serine/threonine-protein kinase [Planctomycetota bacterium]|nr:serine/threonine-protein kinase [Planctomycetota bacterium]
MSTPLEPSDDTAEFGAGKNDSGFRVKGSSEAAAEGQGQEKMADPADLGGSVLGDFHLLRILGSGGMANVYLAEQTSLKRKVALKVLRPDLLADDTNLERFAREATAAAGLNHNNIVQVFGVGDQDGLHYIAQEYVQGVNLREFISRKGPPEAAVAVHIIRQVALALKAAAEAGIVHRDIKPENILLTRQGIVKVTDFGLAQLNPEADNNSLTLTQAGTTMGTPLYMSPEQVNESRVDHRSDIYSLGVTCYHLLAGRPPFRGETAISVAVQHVNKTPSPLATQRTDLPRRLCDLVHRMMAKNPDDRVPDATTLLDELDTLQRRLGGDQGGIATEWIDYEPQVSAWSRMLGILSDFDWQRHKGWLVWPTACLGASLLAGSISLLARPTSPLDTPTNKTSQVSRENLVEKQFFYAIMVDTASAWRAVIDHHPDETLFVNQAKYRLAMHHLRHLEIEEARPIFEELVLAGETEPDLVASGLAGRAVIASYDGHYEESQDVIAELLFPLRDYLAVEMEQLIRNTITNNRERSKLEIRQGLEDFFRNTETDADAEAN